MSPQAEGKNQTTRRRDHPDDVDEGERVQSNRQWVGAKSKVHVRDCPVDKVKTCVKRKEGTVARSLLVGWVQKEKEVGKM